jgi:ATP-dependent RNA helicase RhlE
MEPHNLSFYNLGIAPKMLEVLERMKFVSPTPIQHKAIPIALAGKDVVGIAQTGTGKTLAFGIPMVQQLSAAPGMGLVLVPTRELAIQVNEALQNVLRSFSMTSLVVIGGAPMFRQIKGLRRKPNIIIATPGRLIDHLEQKTANLAHVRVLVLDEADRMYDMGFAPQVRRIIRMVPPKRQTMLFSATMPPEIVQLAAGHMQLPIHVEVAPSGTMAERVTQELFIVKPQDKREVIRALLEQYRGSVLVFSRTRIGARKIARALQQMNHRAAEIHSDLTMGQRKQAIEGFKSGRYRILVATDIAARGIDVRGIELVVNYDLPDDVGNYVHRIGRTGRAGHEGHAVTFAMPDQALEVASIERAIKKTLPRGKRPNIPTTDFAPRSQTVRKRSFRPRFRRRR